MKLSSICGEFPTANDYQVVEHLWVKYDSNTFSFQAFMRNSRSFPLAFMFLIPFGPNTALNIGEDMPTLAFISCPARIPKFRCALA